MFNPYGIVRDFEITLCQYTGAKYAVAVNSCSMAILLAVKWCLLFGAHIQRKPGNCRPEIEIPSRTYVSVPMSIIHAGGWPTFRTEDWLGAYQLKPTLVWDCARRFTSSMYVPGQMQCVSFQAAKILGIEQGGAILHDDPQVDWWLRRVRFDGRTEGMPPKFDHFFMIGWHCYMSPSVAAQGLLKLHSLPLHNADLPNDDYPDLSKLDIFK